MSSFVTRLLALTVVWLFATAALTFAAAHKLGAGPAVVSTTTTAGATVPAPVLVVPDLRRQAFVFSKGILSDAGFSFRIEGSVKGFPSNTVVSQTPAPGTRVLDTGAPLVILHLARTGTQNGLPEDVSTVTPTAVKLAPPPAGVAKTTAAVLPVKVAKTAPKVVTKVVPKPAKAPAKPESRAPAFVVPGARREPLDEITLSARAQTLLVWLNQHPNATDANVKHWLYQHAWIVTGAELGWSHGAEALHTLLAADRRVWELWGIGARSSAVARQALAEVEARSK
jgi:hypothetical protein